jgi:hypothetical protein
LGTDRDVVERRQKLRADLLLDVLDLQFESSPGAQRRARERLRLSCRTALDLGECFGRRGTLPQHDAVPTEDAGVARVDLADEL